MSAAPTEPTDAVMLEGVLKMPVPMIRPILFVGVRGREGGASE